MPSFGKIVGAVSENEPERTDERTDGGDSIGPFGFQPGTNNIDEKKLIHLEQIVIYLDMQLNNYSREVAQNANI